MSTNPQDGSRPTVVLVHGAFADGSSWNGVIERLRVEDCRLRPPVIPLRGIAIDSAYISSFLEQIPGPVLAVGPLLRRCDHHQRRHQRQQCSRACLRLCLRPGRRRNPGSYRKRLQRRRP